MKRTVITLALIIALSIPASGVSACGRNHSRHHHHFFQRHHVEQVVAPVVNDGSYQYYHDVLGYTKAQYLIQIKKMP
ncbi:MAG TPA: hypothetical protein VIK34_05700 [Clostridiaceae bacterium]